MFTGITVTAVCTGLADITCVAFTTAEAVEATLTVCAVSAIHAVLAVGTIMTVYQRFTTLFRFFFGVALTIPFILVAIYPPQIILFH